jgi:integrase
VTPQEFLRILEAAPLHLRVRMTVLDQTGHRTYSEVFSLRWEQIDLASGLVHLGGPLKTSESAAPSPLSKLALDVLSWWKGQQAGLQSPYLFPQPKGPEQAFTQCQNRLENTLRRAGIPYFPIYQLRHGFCTRVSKVAADGVIQKAMRHSCPETKRIYQLGMVEEVLKAIETTNSMAISRITFLAQ